MKKTFFKSIAALLTVTLALTMLSVTAFADDVTTETEQVTYFDFEDGKNPFSKPTGEAIKDDNVVEDADGNKILKPTNGGGFKGAYPFSTDYFTLGSGIKNGWKETARPTRVQFRLKFAGAAQSDVFYFHPLWSADAKQYNTFKFSIKNYNGTIDINATTIWAQRLFYASETGKATARTGGYPAGNNATSLADGSWYYCDCTYDWSKFNADNGWQVSFVFTITDGQKTRVYSETLKERAPTNTNFTGTLPEYTDTTGFSIGFEGNATDTATVKSAIDDLAIWSYDTSDNTVYSPNINADDYYKDIYLYKKYFKNNQYKLDFENGELLKRDTDKSGVFTAQNDQSFVNTNANNPYSDDYNSSAKIAKFATHQESWTAFNNGQLQFLTPDVWSIADDKNLTLTSANLDMVINAPVSYQHIIIYKYKDKENFAFWSLSVGKGTDGTDMSLGIRNYEVTSDTLTKVNNGELTQIPFVQFLNSDQENDSKGFSKTAWSNVGIAYEDDGNVKLTVKRVDGTEFTFDSAYDLDSINERYLALSDTSHATTYVDNVSLSFAEKSEFYKPQAVSATIRANSYADGNTQGLRFKYRLPYEIPEGNTLVEYGAVATAYKTGMDIETIKDGAANTITAKNTAPASDCLGKEFYATVTGITADNTTKCYIARSYVVYEDASGNRTTVYSDNTTANGDYSKRTGCVDGCIVRSVASIAKAMVKAVYANKDNLTIEGNIDGIYDGSKFLSAATADNGAGIINFIVANKAAIEAVSK